MNKDHNQKIVTAFIGLVVLVFVFYIGHSVGKKNAMDKALISVAPEGVNITNEQLDPFWKVWTILSDKYVEATTTDTQKRIWGAIQGLASSQGDPYTVFFPPEEAKTFKSDIAGNFEGVGMEIGIKDDVLTVITPIKNSPAHRAGVKAGDKIIEIDGKSTANLSVEEAVKFIRGARGTSVRIIFIREGTNEPLEKTLVRDVIDIPTLETEIKSDIFIIRLFSFTAQSPELFRVALRDFLKSGKNRLVIDLRGNPGGYLDAAWDIASWFLPSGKTIVTEDFGGKAENRVYRSKGYDVLNKFFGKNYKVAILVNNGSASASEILAGALQEHGVAKLVGIKTFGKGSVQELIEITPETSLKVTIARWLTPKGHNLSHDGLKPDYEVKITQKDVDEKRDPQLDKAIEILKK
ncbi:MAG TPA: S41 family peptidase [Candidatus Paceibacterota bacterium]